MMRLILCFLTSLVLLGAVPADRPADSAKADRILGEWVTEGGKSKVRITRNSDGSYIGTIVWLRDPKRADGSNKLDDKNPDPKLRNRPIVGMRILHSLRFDDEEDEWTDGKVYDPEKGKEYSCYLKMGDNKTLNLRGYIGISVIGRTSTWTR